MDPQQTKQQVADAEENLSLDAAPEDISVLVAAAQEYYRQGEQLKAEKVFRGAYVLSKGSPEILRFIGATLHAQMRIDEALELYDQALVHLPDDPQLLYNKGELLVLSGESDSAIVLLKQVSAATQADTAMKELHQRADTMMTVASKLKQIAGTKQEEALAAEVTSNLNRVLAGAVEDEENQD